MDVRSIVGLAWQMTQRNLRKLIWYGFIPSFFSVIVSSVYIAYQYYSFRHSALFSSTAESMNILENVQYWWSLAADYRTLSIIALVLAIIILAGNYILPPIFKGTMINAIMKIDREESPHGSLEAGLRNFFPLFEFGLLTGAFSITFLLTNSAFILRLWGENAFFVILPLFFIIAIAGLLVNFFATYAEYYIVLEKKGIIKSVMESFVLVFSNMRKTLLVFVLMVLIGARIILNVLLVLLIPMLIVFLTTYLADIFMSTFGVVVMGLISLGILIFSAYLLGLFQVFATAVWVLTFKHLRLKSLGETSSHDEGEE